MTDKPSLIIFDDVFDDEAMTPDLRDRLRLWFEEDVARIRGLPMLIKPAVRTLFMETSDHSAATCKTRFPLDGSTFRGFNNPGPKHDPT